MKAEMITSKGLIEIDLFMKDAPGTVANFVELARDQFYNGKNFHRVVPNFVIQGGCPRGDGYGSLDYSIRSELGPLHYDDEGYIGMASAGNHTECTQFFITHSPTPHLDGRYTIFGKVRKGMEIVHQIQVGDIIREVNILN
jgi:cyclophilin family peptidyl-prolyl cis-trans isomerase